MAEQNKDEQLIDQYLQGSLEGEELERFNTRIEEDEAFRSAVAFQSQLRKSVRRGKVAAWKKEWEEGEKDRRVRWWPWLLGSLTLALLLLVFIPKLDWGTNGVSGEDDAPVEETSTNEPRDAGVNNKERSNGTGKDGEEPPKEEEEVETNKTLLPMASLDLNPYWSFDDFPTGRIKKSSDSSEPWWKLSESEASALGFIKLQNDLKNHIDTLQNNNVALRLELFNGFLLLRTGSYAEAESRIRQVLNSKEFALHDVARWYLSLTLIKQNKSQEARAVLEEIANYEGGGHFKQSDAQRLLEVLKDYQ